MVKLDRSSSLHFRQGRPVEEANFAELQLFGWRFSRVSLALFSQLPAILLDIGWCLLSSSPTGERQ